MSELTYLEEIRDRYAVERARRLRPDSNGRYDYLEQPDDPWTERVERPALRDDVDVIVIGAGLSGLAQAAQLRQAGVERVRLIDRAGDVGGTWYWNRYPAAQCDVESYIYLPMLEELGYIPSMKYVYQPEILQHLQSIAAKFGLYEHACFHTDVLELAWNDLDQMWTALTDRGDAMRAQFVVLAGGFLQRPKLPTIPGLSDFQGKVFHSSRWDYDYTGGEPGPDGGGLPGLRDKRVGLVGTGASGLQIVTPVAAAAEHLYVFQRTPTVILPRNNRPTDPDWADSLEPGWQRERMDRFNRLGNAMPDVPDPVKDGWTEIIFPVIASHGAALFGGPEERKQGELVDLETMEAVRRRVSDIVKDPVTAGRLMPYFRMLCKRPSFHDDFLESFNRPNVTLVDSGGQTQKVTATGLVVGDQEYELDCLIFATGFDAERGLLKAWGVDLVGRDGLRLTDYWKDGMRTFQGIHVRNFPNAFFHCATQNGGPPNYTTNSLEISEHITYMITEARKRGVQSVEAAQEAENQWVQMIKDAVPDTYVEFNRNCTPNYYNNDGHLDDPNRLLANVFLGGSVMYYDMIHTWRGEGELQGLELRTRQAASDQALGATGMSPR